MRANSPARLAAAMLAMGAAAASAGQAMVALKVAMPTEIYTRSREALPPKQGRITRHSQPKARKLAKIRHGHQRVKHRRA